MHPLVSFYNLLGINRKLPEEHIRILYLRDIWGMEQKVIATCENRSQAYVSNVLRKFKSTVVHQHFRDTIENMWTVDEIKLIQFLPRNVIGDIAAMAFIKDILQVNVSHPFFTHNTFSDTFRIRALASLGVQQKRLQEIFGRSQSSISMLIKRGEDIRLDKFDKVGRYDETAEYKIIEKPVSQKFVRANFSSFSW